MLGKLSALIIVGEQWYHATAWWLAEHQARGTTSSFRLRSSVASNRIAYDVEVAKPGSLQRCQFYCQLTNGMLPNNTCTKHQKNFNTRCGAKPNVSPPGWVTSRLSPASQLHFLPYANAIYRMSSELSFVDTFNKNWLPWQCPLRDQKLISD